MERNEILEKRIKEQASWQGINLNFDNPQTIQDKLNFLKANDNTDLKVKCADKYLCGKYCEEILGENLCVPKLFAYDSVDEIEWDELPNQFAIKCNHGSTMNIIVKDKQTANKQDIYNKLNNWMQINYANYWYEMYYGEIKRKILVEPLLQDEPNDTKIWCFNGKMVFCSREVPLINRVINHYDENYNLLELGFTHIRPDYNVKFEKPEHFEEMKKYANKLSSNFKFCRVDFMESGGKLYLGEITFVPWAGYFRFINPEDEYRIGELLDLSDKNKKCVYTSIVGKYDTLMPLTRKEEGWDYICFTDQDFNSDFWEIRPLPKGLEDLSDAKKQRYVKINAHKVLPEYEYSVYIDGNVDIRGNINDLVNDSIVSLGKHPDRTCIYEEGKMCAIIGKERGDVIKKQLDRYLDEGFPVNYGLTQNCILLRRHNNLKCVRLMETWWNEVKNESYRDQLSFMYSCWKNQDIEIEYLPSTIFSSQYFKWKKLHN